MGYSESISHADFKSEEFVSEYTSTALEKKTNHVKKIESLLISLFQQKRGMINLKLFVGKVWTKNVIT